MSIKKNIILFEGNFKNNEYIIPNIEIKIPEDKKAKLNFSIVLLSCGDIPGKTCLLRRILGYESYLESIQTVGHDKVEVLFGNNNLTYRLIFFETGGAERFRSVALKDVKYNNLAIYLFDISSKYNEIDLSFINEIRWENENIKIYIVGNKFDLINENESIEIINREYFERLRSKVKYAMKEDLVDKYFEISVKTGEGIKKLMNSIKMD